LFACLLVSFFFLFFQNDLIIYLFIAYFVLFLFWFVSLVYFYFIFNYFIFHCLRGYVML